MVILNEVIYFLLPAPVKDFLRFHYAHIGFYPGDLIYLLAFLCIVLRRRLRVGYEIILSIIGVLLLSLSSIGAENYSVQRLFLSLSFFWGGILFGFMDLDLRSDKYIKYMFVFLYFSLCLEVILISIGLIKLDSGMYHEIGDMVRRGTTAGPSTMTGYVILLLSGVIIHMCDNKVVKRLILYFTLMVIVFNGTRGALLCVLFITVYDLYLFFKDVRYYWVYVLIFSGMLLVNYQYDIYGYIQNRNLEAIEQSDISSGRYYRYEQSINAYDEYDSVKKVIGAGGALTPYYLYDRYSAIYPELSPHNIYLSYLLEAGAIGLLFVIAHFFYHTKVIIKNIDYEGILIISVILVMNNFEVILRDWNVLVLYWLLYYSTLKKNFMKNSSRESLTL